MQVEDVMVQTSSQPVARWQPDLLNGVTVIQMPGIHAELSAWGDALYRPVVDLVPTSGEAVSPDHDSLLRLGQPRPR